MKQVHTTFLHGGDYNPDQWLDQPEILEKDIEILSAKGINVVTLGVFSWNVFQPNETTYNIEWLLPIIDRLYENGISTILATPSGGKPAWMSLAYPEVNRVSVHHVRETYGNRHNHCFTSPIYRNFTKVLDEKIAEVYGNHPAVLMWHISNEFFGHCYCDLCQEAFRDFLREKYKTIEELNKAYYNAFWSHNYNDFNEIFLPGENADRGCPVLLMDMERFTTKQTIDFYNVEKEAVRKHSSLPVTTNFWGGVWMHLDYQEFAKHVDYISYDAYPNWHDKDDHATALEIQFMYDYMRGLKRQQWYLMESTPSTANWCPVSKLKRPKMHELSSIQSVAAGSQMVGYFQMRRSQAHCEKFHSGVIEWNQKADSRILKDVESVSTTLGQLHELFETQAKSKIAIYYDVNNRFALHYNKGPRNENMKYEDQLFLYHKVLKQHGFNVDIISSTECLDYDLIIVPTLYSATTKVWEDFTSYVEQGGRLLTTVLSGLANENDYIQNLGSHDVFKNLTGLYYEDIDGLYDHDHNAMIINKEEVQCNALCELNEVIDAQVVSTYTSDFYEGYPVLTMKKHNNGIAYHFASTSDEAGTEVLLKHILEEMGITFKKEEVMVQERSCKEYTYRFYMNFHKETKIIRDKEGDLWFGSESLQPYEYCIYRIGGHHD